VCCTVYGGLCTVYGVCLMYAPSSRGRPGSTRGANPERNWKRSFPIGPSRIWGTDLDHVPLPHNRPVERKKRGHLARTPSLGATSVTLLRPIPLISQAATMSRVCPCCIMPQGSGSFIGPVTLSGCPSARPGGTEKKEIGRRSTKRESKGSNLKKSV